MSRGGQDQISLILSPGTRIVTRNDMNRIGGGQLITAGAVAVVTELPAEARHAYKVRFNDSAQAMLRRTEFSILKEFKSGARGGSKRFPSPIERETKHFKKLEQDLGGRALAPRGEIKWKHAMHLMRLLISGISALREDKLRVRLDEHRAALLAIKRGEQAWPEVNAWRLRLHKEFDEALASTQLPERPDYAWANEFLLKARMEMVNSS